MLQILKDIFSDGELSNSLAFKGGTALMFFYGLGRFSVDLDFNLLDSTKEEQVFEKVKAIVSKYGKIKDACRKFYGPVVVIGYGGANLKVEISNRQFDNHYQIKNLYGISLRVMREEDMFAHKLCALLDRDGITGRDIYDTWFFLKRNTPINKEIVESRMNMALSDYIQACIDAIGRFPEKAIMSNIGELISEGEKNFVRSSLKAETLSLLNFFKSFPLVSF